MLNESNGELKCCDSLVSLQEALTKEMDAKFEKITKQKKLNTSLPALPQLSESLTESLENR